MSRSEAEAFELSSGRAAFEGEHLCLHFVWSGSAVGIRNSHRHPIVEDAYLVQNVGTAHSIKSGSSPVMSVCLPEAIVSDQRFMECSTPHDLHVDRALSNFLLSLKTGGQGDRMFWAAEIVRALVDARDRSREKFYLRSPTVGDPYVSEMKIAREFVLARLDRPITTKDVAHACGISPFHFHRIFTRWHSVTPGHYISTERVRRACRKLVLTEEKFSVISSACGFRSPTSFAGIFKSMTGFTPAAFRRMAAHHRADLKIFLQ